MAFGWWNFVLTGALFHYTEKTQVFFPLFGKIVHFPVAYQLVPQSVCIIFPIVE